jgi:3-oxoacyl-[acyl-carrier-protein] synthase II
VKHRVAVTGMGVVSPLGTGVDAFWANVIAERRAIRTITRFPTDGFASSMAAEVTDFDAADFIGGKRLRWTDRFSQFALAATRLAVDDAAFGIAGDGADIGVYIGSALGGLAYADEQHDVFRAAGLDAVRPLLAISVFGGAATCNVAMEFGIRGPNVANGNSCASGAVAIGDAFRAIARGEIRAALAGGCEAPLAPLVFGAFTVIHAMSTRNADPAAACRPFDRDRDGFVMAEGAGMLVLERYDDALARGARIYGEVAGYGITNDAFHMSAPQPEGRFNALAMQRALEEARLEPREVDVINAHGSGTILGDRGEAAALRLVFGADVERLPLTATKGQHGHALGASGAWEAVLALLAITRGVVPRVVNHESRDPSCPVGVLNAPLAIAPRIVLSTSAGFGGINAALVFRTAASG